MASIPSYPAALNNAPPVKPMPPLLATSAAISPARSTDAGAVAAALAHFTVKPLTPTIGAEIFGVDLAKPLDDATLAALHRTLLDWKVVFFRDQDITTEQHIAFARCFGELEVHPFVPCKGQLGFFEWKAGDPADVPKPAAWMLPKPPRLQATFARMLPDPS